jgi:hypothetical protein
LAEEPQKLLTMKNEIVAKIDIQAQSLLMGFRGEVLTGERAIKNRLKNAVT